MIFSFIEMGDFFTKTKRLFLLFYLAQFKNITLGRYRRSFTKIGSGVKSMIVTTWGAGTNDG